MTQGPAEKAWIKCWEDLERSEIQHWVKCIPHTIQWIIDLDGGNKHQET